MPVNSVHSFNYHQVRPSAFSTLSTTRIPAALVGFCSAIDPINIASLHPFLFCENSYKMGRAPCCLNGDRNKGAWTKEEDARLVQHILAHGEGCWRSLPKAAGLHRCGKSCRLRWINYLRPDLKRGHFSEDEDDLILRLHALLGNKWSLIAGRLPGRTDNEIKHYWNSHLTRKLITMGLDPLTHRPFQKNPRYHPSATGNVTEPETARSHGIVQDFFHCPSELSAKSDAASGLGRDEHPHINVNLNLELSISRPSIHTDGFKDDAVVNSDQGESDSSVGNGYLCRYG